MNSPEVTMYTASAYSFLMGTANPPQTTSPRTSYTVTSLSMLSTPILERTSNVVSMPLPAHPIPGSGPPASMHMTPPEPVNMMSDSFLSEGMVSRT